MVREVAHARKRNALKFCMVVDIPDVITYRASV